jgi:hypothetical protein
MLREIVGQHTLSHHQWNLTVRTRNIATDRAEVQESETAMIAMPRMNWNWTVVSSRVRCGTERDSDSCYANTTVGFGRTGAVSSKHSTSPIGLTSILSPSSCGENRELTPFMSDSN